MQTFKEFWKKAISIAGEKDLFFNASAITFNLFICSIPFILILVSIIGYVLSIDEAFIEIVRYGSELLPSFSYESQQTDIITGSETIENLLRPLVGAREVFGIVGLIILIFFTQGLLHSLKHVIFDIFDIEERAHPVVDIVYNFFVFGLLGTVFLFFSLAISFISLFDLSVIKIPYTDIVIQLPWVYDLLNITLPIVFTFFLMFVVFRFISERKISTKVSLMGAFIYTFLFEVARLIVSVYMEYAFSTYRFFYQGYAIVVVITIWTFYTALLFVISVIMAKAFREVYGTHKATVENNPYADLD